MVLEKRNKEMSLDQKSRRGQAVKKRGCRAKGSFQTVLRPMEKTKPSEPMCQGDEGGVFPKSCPDFDLGGNLFSPGACGPMLHATWGRELRMLDLTLPRARAWT